MEQPSHWEHLFRDAQIGLAYGSFTDYRFVFVNDAFAQQRGYRAEELIGRSLFSVIASDARDAAESRIKEIRRRGRLVFESVHQRKDGMTFPVLVEVAAIKDARTNSDSWVAYALDISERKRAERSVTRMMHAITHAGDVIAHIDHDGKFVYVNEVMCRLFGYTKDELLSMRVHDVDTRFTLDHYRELFELAHDGPQGPFESTIRRKDGSVFPAEVVVSRFDVDETPLLQSILRDISGRKEAEARLCQSEERFRLVAEVTNDVLWDWDLATGDHWWSPNAREKFGYDPNQEPSITAWRSRLHPRDRKRVLRHLDECLKSKERMFFDEYKFLLADGSYGVFWDKGRVVYDAEGKAVRMIGTMIDVTAAKRAYASLEQAYVRLQWLSRELQKAEETERRRLSRELHDEFGQLLSALKLSLGRVREELVKRPRTKESVLDKNVMAATKAADRLFASLRELVHGLRPAVLDEFGLVAALQSMVEDIRQGTGLDCRLSVEPKKVHSMIGEELEGPLFRITQELVTNIVRHARATRADIRLRYADGMITLSVQDNGRGGRFAEPRKGYGLRGIHERTELLGGKVEIRSELRRGTIVTVTLPVEPLRWNHSPIGSGHPATIVKARKLPHGKKV